MEKRRREERVYDDTQGVEERVDGATARTGMGWGVARCHG